jgi:hypothetical protein
MHSTHIHTRHADTGNTRHTNVSVQKRKKAEGERKEWGKKGGYVRGFPSDWGSTTEGSTESRGLGVTPGVFDELGLKSNSHPQNTHVKTPKKHVQEWCWCVRTTPLEVSSFSSP